MFSWLLASFVLGFFLGLFWELFRFLRQVLLHKSLFVALEDILFFSLSSLAFWLVSFAFGLGQIRWFSVFATVAGFLLYLFTLGKLVFAATGLILAFFKRCLGVFKRRLLLPILALLGRMLSPLGKGLCAIRARFRQFVLLRRVQRLMRSASRGFQK